MATSSMRVAISSSIANIPDAIGCIWLKSKNRCSRLVYVLSKRIFCID
jgi:hypothetical protein